MRLDVDERRILHAFGGRAVWPNNPARPYDEVTENLPISTAYPSLVSLIRQGYVAEVPEGYALTRKGFEALDYLRGSRIDG